MTSLRNFLPVLSLLLGMLVFVSLASCDSTPSSSAEQQSRATKPPARPIQEAAFMGDLNLMQAHIAAGSDLNQKDEYGSTPLIIATTFGKTDVASC